VVFCLSSAAILEMMLKCEAWPGPVGDR